MYSVDKDTNCCTDSQKTKRKDWEVSTMGVLANWGAMQFQRQQRKLGIPGHQFDKTLMSYTDFKEYRTLLWDGILGHQYCKTLESFAPCYLQKIRETRKLESFQIERKNEGRQPDKNWSLRRLKFMHGNSTKNVVHEFHLKRSSLIFLFREKREELCRWESRIVKLARSNSLFF